MIEVERGLIENRFSYIDPPSLWKKIYTINLSVYTTNEGPRSAPGNVQTWSATFAEYSLDERSRNMNVRRTFAEHSPNVHCQFL